MTVTLPIAHTWDGVPVADRAAAQLAIDGLDLVLRVLAPAAGDPPPASPPGPTDRLWEHEVVEVFVAGPGERYLEVEIGPHGHHLVLRLDGIRHPVESRLPLALSVVRDGDRWAATARLPRAWLPEGPLRVNAYRIHGPADARRYLAHAPVPGPQADFHRLERFVPVDLDATARPLVDDVAALVAAVLDAPRTTVLPRVAVLAAAQGSADLDRLALDTLGRARDSRGPPDAATPRGPG